ncbi:MAG: SRPBCC family protein [Bryobacteraceae bacterium]
MPSFRYSSVIEAPVAEVFRFHQQPGAFEQLAPAFPRVEVVHRTGAPLEPGSRLDIEMSAGPLRTLWRARHTELEQDRYFVDVQDSGPFRSWTHRHLFEPAGPHTRLTDAIEFSLPGGPFIDAVAGWAVRLALTLAFRERHRITRWAVTPRRQPDSRTS